MAHGLSPKYQNSLALQYSNIASIYRTSIKNLYIFCPREIKRKRRDEKRLNQKRIKITKIYDNNRGAIPFDFNFFLSNIRIIERVDSSWQSVPATHIKMK